MNDRVTFRESVALQPTSLQSGLEALTRQFSAIDLSPLTRGTTALAGIGASLYAATVGAAHMRRCGLRAFALPATDLYDPGIDAADAYVALSASGRSVEPIRAMELRPQDATFGISRKLDTPLAGAVRTMIATESGPDGGPNTTSYVGSLLAMGLMADHVGRTPSGVDWRQLPNAVADVLENTRAPVERAALLLAGCISLDCVGAGEGFGTAGYASLLLREAVRVAAQQWDTLNFLHGPMEGASPKTGILLSGNGREVQLAQSAAGFGIATVLITSRPDVAETNRLVVVQVPAFSPGLPDAILQALPIQLLTADMMEQAGLPVCEFRYRQSGTKTPEEGKA